MLEHQKDVMNMVTDILHHTIPIAPPNPNTPHQPHGMNQYGCGHGPNPNLRDCIGGPAQSPGGFHRGGNRNHHKGCHNFHNNFHNERKDLKATTKELDDKLNKFVSNTLGGIVNGGHEQPMEIDNVLPRWGDEEVEEDIVPHVK
ncbi:hypothetical protein APHAL10511_003614 [Amanita phalloides]|nr:hypothetical protein APHAL10511_003614 [Amanita phalloides]